MPDHWTAAREPTVLWRVGDRWRDFLEEVLAVKGPVVVVTEHGSIQVMDVAEGWVSRLPGRNASKLINDVRRRPLAEVQVATPCGFLTVGESSLSWQASSWVVLVYAGDPGALEVLLPVDVDRVEVDASQHPPEACGALHCVRRTPAGRWQKQ